MKSHRLSRFLVSLIVVGISGSVSIAWGQNLQVMGNLDVQGNTSVGDTSTRGNLIVTGQIGSGAAPSISATGDGGVLWQGVLGGAASGGGDSLFQWFPRKNALRLGGSSWTESALGEESVAFGTGSNATGVRSVALGGGFGGVVTTAAGDGSLAQANGQAFGKGSTALAGSWTFGEYTLAAAWGMASGNQSVGLGGWTSTDADFSVALSQGTAGGAISTAMSGGSTFGQYSASIGLASIAEGKSSVAIGAGTYSHAYSAVVVGTYNSDLAGASATTWQASDPVFVIGNGTGNEADAPEVQSRNAFVVLKSGDIKIPKRQGDVLMGEFGSPE